MTDKLHITAEMLRDHNACADQVELFQQTFPQGATIPDDLEMAARAGLDTRWAFEAFGLTGAAECYYGNGQLRYREHYEQGELHGVLEVWRESGRLQYRENYEQGKPHGVWEEWRESGQLWSRRHFEQGKLVREEEI